MQQPPHPAHPPTAPQAVQERNTAPLQEAVGEEHAAWLAQALSRPAAAPEQLVDFLMGSSRSGLHISPSFYGCMHQYKEVVCQHLACWLLSWC